MAKVGFEPFLTARLEGSFLSEIYGDAELQKKAEPIPTEFFDRADEIIKVANSQLRDEHRSKVSASTLYAAARFNAFVSAASYSTGDQMAKELTKISDYFVDQYKKMLDEHLEDYVANFSKNIGPR